MESSLDDTHADRRFAPTALMLGNFVTGCSVLAPAGMLGELSAGLGVSIRDAGLLITFGAVVLCIGSPLTAWLTSRIERRTLLDRDARGVRAHQCCVGVCADYATPARHPPGHAGGRRALHAAGRGHRRPDRAGGKARQHHRLYLSRLVAGRGGRPAADHLHRQPLRLAHGLWRHRRDRLFQFPAAGVAAAGRTDRRAGRSQDLGRCRAQPHDRAAAV